MEFPSSPPSLRVIKNTLRGFKDLPLNDRWYSPFDFYPLGRVSLCYLPFLAPGFRVTDH